MPRPCYCRLAQRRATCRYSLSCFFFNDTATTEIYTLSLHDALPISTKACARHAATSSPTLATTISGCLTTSDRKSTRLNSSHMSISYAVFCLKKKKQQNRSGGAAPTRAHGVEDQPRHVRRVRATGTG